MFNRSEVALLLDQSAKHPQSVVHTQANLLNRGEAERDDRQLAWVRGGKIQVKLRDVKSDGPVHEPCILKRHVKRKASEVQQPFGLEVVVKFVS